MKTNLKHIAIIMDGNGRWANQRGKPRFWGHVRGSSIVSEIVESASDMGAKALTLYAFSTENWSRPSTEISLLFSLLKKFLKKEATRIHQNNIQFKVIGDVDKLPNETQKLIFDLTNQTKLNSGMKLNFAFNYGSRDEILKAVNKFIIKNPGKIVDQKLLENELYTHDIGDVDLLIRTGGDIRVSNFLLWQIAYAELFFTDTKWPDFTVKEFQSIINNVQLRERRFGSLGSQNLDESSDKAKKHQTLNYN